MTVIKLALATVLLLVFAAPVRAGQSSSGVCPAGFNEMFNVNQPAQEAALASLHETDAVARRIAHTRRCREELYDTLAGAGLDPIPSHANFVYADVPDGDGDAMADRLLHAGFIVRALRGFGAPQAIRVTVGTDEENQLFAHALQSVVG